MHSSDPKVIDEATAIIKRYGAEAYVQSLQKRLMDEAWTEVNKIKLEPGPKKILLQMADFLINRAV
jgi:geranylgeranyl pyrophosphate synthase